MQRHTLPSQPSPECLIEIVIGRADAGDHESLGVPPEGGLEEACQLGVAVGDVGGAAVYKGRDDVAQRREGEVDLGGLLETLTWELIRNTGVSFTRGSTVNVHVV